jgi:hypothetical protein
MKQQPFILLAMVFFTNLLALVLISLQKLLISHLLDLPTRKRISLTKLEKLNASQIASESGS